VAGFALLTDNHVRDSIIQALRRAGWDVVRAGAGRVMLGAAALGFARAIATLRYGVTASDPPTFLVTAFVLASAALLAGFVPARRAARVDPLVTLRAE
jgi:ABC-type lipoprotein release transport system permease subunit